MRQLDGCAGITLAAIVAFLVSLAAWVTHVIVCLKTAAWGFLIAGAIVAPIGVIHGIGIWFNVW